jgi:hypothetical protein
MYHLTTLFEEQVRVPGWLIAGPLALSDDQRRALGDWAPRRTFNRDVNATLLDLLGALDARAGFPFAGRLLGRSLLRPPPPDNLPAPMSTVSGVWDPDQARYGAMAGDLLVVRGSRGRWDCYDAASDPAEHDPHVTNLGCLMLATAVGSAFGDNP